MNFIKILSILPVLILSANQVVALDYNDEIPVSSTFRDLETDDISAAKLLQNYVASYESKINRLFASYEVEDRNIIDAANQQLKQMSRSLDIIRFKSVNPDVVPQVMQSIVSDLKTLNNRMKIYLEQEKIIYFAKVRKIQKNYDIIGVKISNILDSIVGVVTNSLIDKKSLSLKEQEIVKSLISIREQNDNIKNFRNVTFWSEGEMKEYFRDIIKIIRVDIRNIQQFWR